MLDDDPWRLGLLAEYGGDAGWFLRRMDALTAEVPDSPRAVADVQRFLHRGSNIATDLRSFRADPLALDLLIRLGTCSRWAMDLVVIRANAFWSVIQERRFREILGREELRMRLESVVSRFREPESKINALVRTNQHEVLRIILGDISESMTFEAITAEIADLADATITVAMDLAREKLRPRYGDASCDMVVLGMGKLGGRELNYSSDIDLIFVYRENGETSGGRQQVENHTYFCKLGAELIKLLGDHHAAGWLFRVDMRLRPEGNAGELATSFAQTVHYYEHVGRPWERQAMLKVRPVAGDIALGERLMQRLRPWVFPKDPAWESIEETRQMRRRIEERADNRDVKTGIGGIRDIEFLVQFYQLVFGGRHPELRHRATLPALRLLTDTGLLSSRDARTLARDYTWLRMVEHRLQMYEDRQLHALPDDKTALNHLAFRCGFRGERPGQGLIRRWRTVRARVREFSDTHYLQVGRDEDASYALLTAAETPARIAEQLLGPYGFADPVQAAERLRDMGSEPFFILSQSRTQRNLVQLMPQLLPRVAASPDPDTTLANVARIVQAVGGRSTFFRLLAEEQRLLRIVVHLAGWADFVIDFVTRFPGLPDELAERGWGLIASPLDQRVELAEMTTGLTDPLPQAAWFQARELIATAISDLAGADSATIGHRLGGLAAAIVQVLLDHAAAALAERWGMPVHDDGRPHRCCVLGVGKVGSGEMSYASDLDVIIVCDPGGRCAKKDRQADEFWTRVIRKVIGGSAEHRLYEVDPRLRPWGDQGQLVVTTGTLADYWSKPRELWERMAMTRLAVLAGDAELGAEAIAIIRASAIAADLPADAAQQVRDMRGRLEQTAAGKDHLKRGMGGYVDVEFLVQYRQLGLPVDALPIGIDTATQLGLLVERGLIPAEAADECRQSLALLRRIEARMRLFAGRAISSLPTDQRNRQRFARCAGYADRDEMDLDLHVAREAARHWFDRLVV